MRALLATSLLTLALPAQDVRWLVSPELSLTVGDQRLTARVQEAPTAGEAFDLSHDQARITFGPDPDLGVDDRQSFTIELDLRTGPNGFCTPLMCREDGAVHYSLVMGRTPGTASFEMWGWSRERATTSRRIDDDRWHTLQLCYDAESRVMALFLDGDLDATTSVRQSFRGSSSPRLRLGNNLDSNVHQPFNGWLRNVRMVSGVPDELRRRVALRRKLRVLSPERVDAMLTEWNDHQRRRRVPSAATDELDRVRANVQDALGLWPPPGGEPLAGRASPLMPSAVGVQPTDFASYRSSLPLSIVEGGSLERDGYRLTRIYWPSFEGYHASGWLYRPTAPVRAKRPAVLCPHGHWQNGARHPTVQSRCIVLAQAGYVVLAVDSIHVHDDRVGLSPVSVMTWNNLRGLQLLRALPEVDAERIGCTGASGGGQQTYYLTALRTGLAAAVPVVMACHFHEILEPTGVHCSCNHVPWLVSAVDQPQMSACFAPTPQLFLCVTGDWTNNFPRNGYLPIRRAYAAQGAGERCLVRQWDKGHAYDRPMRNAMYAFMDRWLRDDDAPERVRESGSVKTEPLNVLMALDRRDVARSHAAIRADFAARLAAPAASDASQAARRFGDLLARTAPDQPVHVTRDGDAWLVQTDVGVQVPVTVLASRVEPRGTTLVVGAAGRVELLMAPWIEELRQAGHNVLVADVRYTGELDRGSNWRELYGRFYGRDEGQMAVRDLRCLAAAVPQLVEQVGELHLLARGWVGAPALLAAAVDERIRALAAPELGAGWRRSDRRPRLARILLHGDLSDAALLLRGRSAWLGGCPETDEYRAAENLRVTTESFDVSQWTDWVGRR